MSKRMFQSTPRFITAANEEAEMAAAAANSFNPRRDSSPRRTFANVLKVASREFQSTPRFITAANGNLEQLRHKISEFQSTPRFITAANTRDVSKSGTERDVSIHAAIHHRGEPESAIIDADDSDVSIHAAIHHRGEQHTTRYRHFIFSVSIHA